jgi:uncharacterized protein (DUF1778 family)
LAAKFFRKINILFLIEQSCCTRSGFVRQIAVKLYQWIIEVIAMQTIHIDSKTERIEARVRPEDKRLFKRAADLSGMKFTEFAIQALKDAANKIIKEHTLMELSLADQKLFVKSMLNAAEPNQRLMEASKRHKKMIQD